MTMELSGSALRAAVEDLLFEYASALDDAAIERWPGFFTEDGLYEVVARENLAQGRPLALIRCEGMGMLIDRATALKEILFYSPRSYRRLVSNVRPRGREGGEIEVTANFVVLETLVEQSTTILAVGQYRDVVVVRDGGLRFREKRCIYDTTLLPGTVVYPF